MQDAAQQSRVALASHLVDAEIGQATDEVVFADAGLLPALDALPGAGQPRARACRHAADVLGRWGLGDLEDVVVQVVSELVANAAERPSPPLGLPGLVRLTLRLLPTRVSVEGFGTDPAAPILAQAEADDERGLGLVIVRALSCGLAVTPLPNGKVVTAQVRRPGAIGTGQ